VDTGCLLCSRFRDVVTILLRPMSSQEPQAPPRPAPSPAAPAIPDIQAALAALLAALAGHGTVAPLSADPVIPRKAAAGLVGLSEATFDRVCRRGDGPAALRLSARRVGFRLSDLMAWIADRRVSGARD
jgi:predicted DNA-binding transcriptional regulator AlpA